MLYSKESGALASLFLVRCFYALGWEDWMEEFEAEKISDILTGIFKEAHQGF